MFSDYQLKREQWVPVPRDQVFAFFADARNLEALTPPWLNFNILAPPPGSIGAGTIIQYRLRLHGIPIRWKTEITRWSPPFEFEDLQLSGPYRLWRHTHQFESIQGGTRIVDQLHYRLPFGLLGRVAHRLFVRRDVERIFDYRRERVRALFGSETENSQ